MATEIELPPALQHLADLHDQQPPEVRVLFHYCLILALIDDEKARFIGTRVGEEREWLTVETVVGDVFEIGHPRFQRKLRHS